MSETIKVRIAVSVGVDADSKPAYVGYGYTNGESWDDILGDFDALEKEKRYWVTAEIPIEEDKEFAGTVEPLAKGPEPSHKLLAKGNPYETTT